MQSVYELIAIGPGGRHRWRRPLPADLPVRLGRSPLDGWAVPWDMRISREHADLLLAGEQLHIRCLESAHNAIHCGPQRVRDAAVGPHETFRIGSTIFCLLPAGEPVSADVVPEQLEPRPGCLQLGPHAGSPTPVPQPLDGLVEASVPTSGRASSPGLDGRFRTPCDQPLGAYSLVEAIHRGVWADIYMARHAALGRWAALQVQEAGEDPVAEPIVRLRHKAQLLASFRHPHLPICHDAGQAEGQAFLAMEWIEGQPLGALPRGRPLSIRSALDLIRQAAGALAYAHRCGVIHREVAPAHLLVDRDGTLVLLGWSRAVRLGDGSMSAYEQRGSVIADPEYSSPEQIADCRRVDRRTDIYSLGCTLFYLLTGRVPFPSAAAPAPQLVPSLREVLPEAPLGLERLVLKMLAPDPEQRFSQMEDFLAALEPLR